MQRLLPDIPVRSTLDELVQHGIVELGPEGIIELVREAHVPADGIEGKLTILGNDPAELFMTVAHNVEDPTHPWLQRKVVYDNPLTFFSQSVRFSFTRLDADIVAAG